MKKIGKLKLLVFTLCLLFLANLYGCASLKEIVENKSRQNEESAELTEAFCQDCKGPYCLRIWQIIFSSDQGMLNNKKDVIFLERGNKLTIRAFAICCKWPGVARSAIFQATLSKIGTRTDELLDLRTGQWDNASVSFDKIPPGTYELVIKFRASTRRGMDKKIITVKVR